jgi:hypothetical protein
MTIILLPFARSGGASIEARSSVARRRRRRQTEEAINLIITPVIARST